MNIKCSSCDNDAEIFQVSGDYCIHCWQEKTYPDVGSVNLRTSSHFE